MRAHVKAGARMGAKTGACALAFLVAAGNFAEAKAASCASPPEMSAVQASAVQQELMDAALGCGGNALQKFNAFQTTFGPELRKSDALMLKMFKRTMGAIKGDAAYNAFKTRAASDAEIRRIHAFADFCRTTDMVFDNALALPKPSLEVFAAGISVQESIPVASCPVAVASNQDKSRMIVPAPRPSLPDDRP